MTEPDTRTRLLDAAERAFAEAGLAGARVNAIAAEAGANKAMLYYYFGDKEGLYNAVLERVFAQVSAVVAEVEASGAQGAEAQLRRFFEGYAAILAEHPHLVRLMVRSLLDDAPAQTARLGPRMREVVPRVAAAVAAGQARGELRAAVNPALVAPTIVGPLVFFELARPLVEASLGGADLRETWRRHAADVLFNGLLARPGEGG
jgi:AcrR family transcriptional regulator